MLFFIYVIIFHLIVLDYVRFLLKERRWCVDIIDYHLFGCSWVIGISCFYIFKDK